jgi:hypothetical protein
MITEATRPARDGPTEVLGHDLLAADAPSLVYRREAMHPSASVEGCIVRSA